MDSQLFDTKLVNHKIFKDIKESVKDNDDKKLSNLFELKDDVLYVWNSLENCLFSVNLKRLEENEEVTPYQKLHLLSPPAFNVERIIASECGSRLCVWGSRGVTVAELPSRWGRGGLFDSGSKTVLCKSYSLDERFLYSQGEIHKVHWHPKSLSHLLVLVSDNTMRLYNIALKGGPKLVKIFTIGPKPTGSLGQTVLDSLGDTAVDFIPTPDTEHLLILSGNGDVYMMQCNLDSKHSLQANLKGPLAMYPPADDNYGSESCSIIALGGIDTPTLVVIASASAELYHCLLLPNATEKEEDSHALYVIESVELNVTLNTGKAALQYVHPLNLYPVSRNSYACCHGGGVHAVSAPALDRLAEYAAAGAHEMESILQAICHKPSCARDLVCSSRACAGLAVCAQRRALLVLCCGDLIVRSLEPWNIEEQLFKDIQLKNPALDQDDVRNILREYQKLSFTTIIQEVLERKVSQPILKLDKKEDPSPRQCLEILTQSTVKLRTEYMLRQQRAAVLASRKAVALQALQLQQLAWLGDLQNEIDNVKRQSMNLQEKRSLAEKYQDDLKYRCSRVLRYLRTGTSSAEEKRALSELLQHQRAVENAKDKLYQLKEYALKKSDEMKNRQEEYKKKDTVLGKSHSDTISSVLQQQTSQISNLIDETKLLKDQLGVV